MDVRGKGVGLCDAIDGLTMSTVRLLLTLQRGWEGFRGFW